MKAISAVLRHKKLPVEYAERQYGMIIKVRKNPKVIHKNSGKTAVLWNRIRNQAVREKGA